MMEVVIRAFDENGYHRDIAVFDEKQVWRNDGRVTPCSQKQGLVGVGVCIDPKDFSEMEKFEVVIVK